MIIKEESNLRFAFTEDNNVVKFDETEFYRKIFNHMPQSKGVDFLADSKEYLQFIEIKNCVGHEIENVWRTGVDNSCLSRAPRDLPMEERESLDREVVKKVVSTIACLVGAATEEKVTEKAQELIPFFEEICDGKVTTNKKKIMIILFLEGDFDTYGPAGRTKKMIMQRLQQSIKAKLKWLNCQVAVVDSDTYKDKFFQVEK